jgi:hypothetical protein
MTTQAELQQVQYFFELLYPNPPAEALLVLSNLDNGRWYSQWFRSALSADAAVYAHLKAAWYDIYLGIGLRHPDCTPTPNKRGDSPDVYALPGLWIEFDHNAGVHAAPNLPTPDELLAFIEALPFRFSLLVNSTGGYHAYLLFKELWVLDTPAERDAATLLLRRFQRTIQAQAAAQGWKVDSTADLARVLRPAGTLNHKSGTPKPVTILYEDPVRYNPSDIADASWLATIEDADTSSTNHGDFPPARLEPIVDGCAWSRHCRDDAATLTEPEWYGMLSIIGRCEDGAQRAHEWSAPYPRYRQDETAEKLKHALTDAGPRTCSNIRYNLDADSYCRDCQHWGKVKSPILLGMPSPAQLLGSPGSQNGTTPTVSPEQGATAPCSIGSSNGSGATSTWGTPAQQAPDPRPDIIIAPDITRIVDEAQAALLALPEAPVIYQRARRLSVIARGVKPPRFLHRAQDLPISIEASSAHLMELIAKAAKWWEPDKRTKRYVLALPPRWIVEALQGRPAWPFPMLEGIICSPTLRPDGSLLTTPGYDPETGLYLDTNDTEFPLVPSHPTLDHARAAIGCLHEAIKDFPFADSWHFSATLAAILSLVCRFAILGNVPLFAIRATTRGSGKSLLADVISIIGTGRAAPRWPQVTEDEEERKRLLTVALAGYPVIHIDNVTRPLGSPALDLALTAPSFSDRILGKNDSREAPLSMVWLASGNNMQFKGDMARRIVPIDLDPKMERPEERTGFHHNPLTPWVQQERPHLTVAALTIVKAYFEAQCPPQDVTSLGSFEQWSDLVRQALIWAGEADPCEGRKGIEAESDPQYERLAVLLEAWAQCYPNNDAWTLAQVKGDIQTRATLPPHPPNQWNRLQEALGAFDKRYEGKSLNTQVLGYEFRKFQGRTIAGRRFVTTGSLHHAQQWALEQV